MTTARRLVFPLVLLLLCTAAILCAVLIPRVRVAAPGAGQPGGPTDSRQGQPVLHLLAPSADYAGRYDSLIPEAALRLTAIDLAARYGACARFWAVDQLRGVPADAYPRLQVSDEKMPPMPYLKIVRRGDSFFFSASVDGKDYLPISSLELPMAAGVHVGLWGPFDPHGLGGHTSASDVRLNNRPVAAPERATIGTPLKPSTINIADGAWTIETRGSAELPKDDDRERGEFLHVPAQGDFELTARLEVPDESAKAYPGVLVCREGFDLDSPTVGIIRDAARPWPVLASTPIVTGGITARWSSTCCTPTS